MSYEENSHLTSCTPIGSTINKMHRWTTVLLMGAFACATTLDPVFAEDPTAVCPEPETAPEPDPEPPEYDRKLWKHWKDADKDCQDARQEVLVRDSEVPVTFKPRDDEKECKVATGQWTCPYTGTVITDASKVDVDHMVALKDAHESGGWGWPADQRQAYANGLDDPTHLLATSQYGNRSKGAKGPDEWLPPLESARCQYIQDWVKVKEGWELGMSESEYGVITYMLKICSAGQVPVLPQG